MTVTKYDEYSKMKVGEMMAKAAMLRGQAISLEREAQKQSDLALSLVRQ